MAMPMMDDPMPPELLDDQPLSAEEVDKLIEVAETIVHDRGVSPGAAGRFLAEALADESVEMQDSPRGAYQPGSPERAAMVLLGERPPRWRCNDDGSAEWAMRHVATAAAELAMVQAQAEAWKAQVDDWLQRRSRPLLARQAFFEAHLEDYAVRRRELDEKHKTLVLPSGKVATTGTAEKVEVVDPEALTAWARAKKEAELVRTKHEPAVAELRKATHVAEEVGGWEVELGLSCGHWTEPTYRAKEDVVVEGELVDGGVDQQAWPKVLCTRCPGDAPETLQLVINVRNVKPRFRKVVRHTGLGFEVPGVTIEPATVTAKVKPGA